MKHLQGLVNLITRNKLKKIAILDLQSAPTSQVNQLYQEIANGNVIDDAQAAEALFGDPNDRRYSKVKHDLRQRLLNTVFFIDAHQKQEENYSTAFYSLYRQYSCARILWHRSVRDTAVSLLEKILPKAIEYEITEIVVSAARLLRYYYGVLNKDIKQYKQYQRLARRWERIQQDENIVVDYYEELLALYANTVGVEAETQAREKAAELLQEINSMRRSKPEDKETLLFRFSAYVIQVALYINAHIYRDTIDICNQALEYLSNKKHAPSGYSRLFLLQIIASSIILKDYREGERAINACIRHSKEGTIPWFNLRELHLTLYLHSEQFNAADEIFYRTYQQKGFKSLTPSDQERWRIYEAYIQWLRAINKTTQPTKETTRFRLGKFMNQLSIYSKDKGGMNITILIIKTLWLIKREEYDMARQHIDQLDRYNSRYMKKDEMYRTQLFVRMICQLPKGDFHKEAVQRKANRYFQKLEDNPLSVSQQAVRQEIIPFEILWGYLIELLDYKLH